MKALHYWMGVGVMCASVLTAGVLVAADDKPTKPAGHDHKHDHGDHDHGMQMDPKMAEMFAACEKAGMVGEQHKKLARLEGTWNTTMSWQMTADMEPMVSESTTKCEMVMGDRYLKSHCQGSMGDQSFEGLGFTGYDNTKKKYVSTWLDNMATGIMMSEGEMSADGKTLTLISEGVCPLTGKTIKMRLVETFIDNNNWTMDFYTPDPMTNKEFKSGTITYKRAS